jgi:hypothetical protein
MAKVSLFCFLAKEAVLRDGTPLADLHAYCLPKGCECECGHQPSERTLDKLFTRDKSRNV